MEVTLASATGADLLPSLTLSRTKVRRFAYQGHDLPPENASFSVWLAYDCEQGALDTDDIDLAAEQLVSFAKGMGDLER